MIIGGAIAAAGLVLIALQFAWYVQIAIYAVFGFGFYLLHGSHPGARDGALPDRARRGGVAALVLLLLGQAIGPVVYGYRLSRMAGRSRALAGRRGGGDGGRTRLRAPAAPPDTERRLRRPRMRQLVCSRGESAHHRRDGLGCRDDAAEIKPIEPVWVIPAKGAAGCRTAPTHRRQTPDVAIIGAGVIGLGIAWRLAARGASVDGVRPGRGRRRRQPCGRRACWRPAAEAEPGEEALVALGREARRAGRHSRPSSQQASGIDVELRQRGHAGGRARPPTIRRGCSTSSPFSTSSGCRCEWISAAETRRREPHLAGKLAGAVWSPQDHQVDNRKLAAALRVAAESGRRHRSASIRAVKEISSPAGAPTASCSPTAARSRPMWSCWRPAPGRAASAGWRRSCGRRCGRSRARCWRCAWTRRRRSSITWCGRPGAYLVPRRDGRLLVGATVEEKGFDTHAHRRRRADAARSGVAGGAGGRGAADRGDVGRASARQPRRCADPRPWAGRGLIYATGHHRNGILLTPVTADAIARLVLDGEVDPAIRPFGIERFLPPRAAAAE